MYLSEYLLSEALKKTDIDVEFIRCLCLEIGYIPEGVRGAVWEALLGVSNLLKTDLDTAIQSVVLDMKNQRVVTMDAERVWEYVLFFPPRFLTAIHYCARLGASCRYLELMKLEIWSPECLLSIARNGASSTNRE
jgi:hypothetical protein